MTELWPPEPSRNRKGSSAQVEWHQGQIWELKDGRVIRTRNYSNPADASNPPSCGSRQSTLSVTQFACSAARAGGNRRSARLRPALATLPPPRDTAHRDVCGKRRVLPASG